MADVAVFVDDRERFAARRYVLKLLIEAWRRAGRDIVICDNTRRPPEARVAVLHVDLTRLPPAWQALSRFYPAVLNLRSVDISKRRVSRQLLARDDDHAGPVIVKTDANCGGVGERAPRYRTPVLGRLRSKLDRRRHWTETGILSTGDYPVYPSLREVPAAVWSNPALVVERFLAERHEDLYVLRQWVFFGDNGIGRISYSNDPVIKANNVVSYDAFDNVPESLRAMRDELGFDYGKFDYVEHDGEAVLLDANRTPTHGADFGTKSLESVELLARGINKWLT